MHRIIAAASAALAAGIAAAAPAAADDVADFYKGRTLDMLVAAPAGGGFTAYARTVAQHIVRHIPGRARELTSTPGIGARVRHRAA